MRKEDQSYSPKNIFTSRYFGEQLQSNELFQDARLYKVPSHEQIKSEEKNAFITGVAGQDGSYLAEYLLELGYTVYGCDIKGPKSENIARLQGKLKWVDVDLTDEAAVSQALKETKVNEIYHLAAFTHVGESFDPANLDQVWNDVVTTNHVLLTATQLRIQETKQQIKYFYPGTSELFGNQPALQNEHTPFDPQSPYAEAKLVAVEEVRHFRDKYDMKAKIGLLFNHGSERRPVKFIEAKIAQMIIDFNYGFKDKEKFGNLKAKRDIGWAKEFVELIYTITQTEDLDEAVVGTRKSYQIKNLIDYAFKVIDLKDWKQYFQIETDPSLVREREVNFLQADTQELFEKTGRQPEVDAKKLIKMLIMNKIAEVEASIDDVVGEEVDKLIPTFLNIIQFAESQPDRYKLVTKHNLSFEPWAWLKVFRRFSQKEEQELSVSYNPLPPRTDKYRYVINKQNMQKNGFELFIKYQDDMIALAWDKSMSKYWIIANEFEDTTEAVDEAKKILEKIQASSFTQGEFASNTEDKTINVYTVKNPLTHRPRNFIIEFPQEAIDLLEQYNSFVEQLNPDIIDVFRRLTYMACRSSQGATRNYIQYEIEVIEDYLKEEQVSENDLAILQEMHKTLAPFLPGIKW